MRILTRYILKEIFSHSLLGLLVFTFVIFIRQLGTFWNWWCGTTFPCATWPRCSCCPYPTS